MGVREALGLPARRNGDGDERSLREELRSARWQAATLEENFQRLEGQMAEDGWRRQGANLEREFTRDGLDDLISMSRAMYMVNPLIQRAVNVTGFYTWAQGVNFNAKDEKVQDSLVTPMVDDYGNRASVYGHQARLLTDVDQMVDGNTFTSLFTDDKGLVYPRCIPTEEIRNIFHDPDDYAQTQFYLREWNQQELDRSNGRYTVVRKKAYYPDWRYQPSQRPAAMGEVPVRWDAPIMHQRTGGLKQMLFGVPETYAAIDWARAYKKFLEDWHTIVASLARFAWRATSTGKRKGDTKRKLGGDATRAELLEQQRNPGDQEGAGAVAIMARGDELTPIPKTGANTSADDAKPSRLMVASAMNLADTVLSNDPQQGALATAKTLDRPSELGFLSRQAMWSDWHQDVFAYAAEKAEEAGTIPKDADYEVEVTFPPILEHDAGETVSALVAAATLDGKVEAGTIPRERLSRLLMETIGVDDVEEALKELSQELPTEGEATNGLPEDVQGAVGALMEAAKVVRDR